MHIEYGSAANQLYNLAHFAFAFWLLMIFFPRHMFAARSDDAAERFVSGYLIAVCLYITTGYVLVFLKLFEVLALVPMILCIIFRRYLRRDAGELYDKIAVSFQVAFYNLLETGFWIRHKIEGWKIKMIALRKPQSWSGTISRPDIPIVILLLVVFGCATYIRFYDALTDAAPVMSDSYVALAWMKYIEDRTVFRDGIYPQGSHIIMAYMHKFSAIDQLYILKYSGPMYGVFVTGGLYFTVSRWSGNRLAGVAAAAVFGIFGREFLGGGWERQIASFTQEFAMVFVAPSLYFFYKYFRDGRKSDLFTGWCGCTVAGLVHTLIFGYTGMGLLVFIGVAFLIGYRELRNRIWLSVLSGIASVLVAFLPIQIGSWMGIPFNSAAEGYVLSQTKASLPHLYVWDFAAIIGTLMLSIAGLCSKTARRGQTPELYAAAFCWASFLLYYLGPTLTNSKVLETRVGYLWAIAIPICIGMGIASLSFMVRKYPYKSKLETGIVAAVLLLLVMQSGLSPISSYRKEWSSGVEQYLRIAKSYPPKTWMIVSQNEGYDLALLNGYHMYLGDFVRQYDPTAPPLIRYGEKLPDQSIASEVFIFHEKEVFRLDDPDSEPLYEQRERDNAKFKEWIELFKKAHNGADVFYEDDKIAIYHVQLPDPERDKNTKIWNG